MYSSQINSNIQERVHTHPGVKSGGEGVRRQNGQKAEKWPKKWLPPILLQQNPKEMDYNKLTQTCPSPQVAIERLGLS